MGDGADGGDDEATPALLLVAKTATSYDQERPWACTAFAAAGLSVTVTNAATGQPMCDASVTASEGAYSERLFDGACSFAGAVERLARRGPPRASSRKRSGMSRS
jgi:hypothetical protein